jgi:protein-S-isoprenylcysteine O-methyltransferase Ste14
LKLTRGVGLSVRAHQNDPDCNETEGTVMKLNLVTLAVVIIGLSLFGMYAAHLPWTAWRIAGIAIAAPAFILFVAARIELGRAFSVQARATTLVTTGVYSRVRNPIYFFGAMLILGIIIWMGRPWLLLIFAVLIPLQVVRSRKEERVLTEKFGAAYLDYKQKTWF